MYSKIVSGAASYDVIIPSEYMISKMINEDLLAELDFSNIPNYKYIDSKYKNLEYYKESEEKVLDNINLTIMPKTTVGIIGSTGCGKTTLVSMIPRLYDADEGQVLVDGIDVKDYSIKNLRDGVSMVLQKNVLFSGSIEDNLRWGNENASEEEIISASKNAQADKFIATFKNGYKTDITSVCVVGFN